MEHLLFAIGAGDDRPACYKSLLSIVALEPSPKVAWSAGLSRCRAQYVDRACGMQSNRLSGDRTHPGSQTRPLAISHWSVVTSLATSHYDKSLRICARFNSGGAVRPLVLLLDRRGPGCGLARNEGLDTFCKEGVGARCTCISSGLGKPKEFLLS